MKTSKLVIAAAAALALAVPVASATTKPVRVTVHHKTVVLTRAASQKKKTAHVVYRAPFGTTPIITPRYIYIPAPAPDPNAVAPTASMDDCSFSGNDCTPEQACDIWGEC